MSESMQSSGREMVIEDKYEMQDVLGEGTYGVVYKARVLGTDDVVAIKKIRLDSDDEGIPSTTLREISSLKELNHRNIIKLQEVIYRPLQQKLFLVFEFLPMDLRKYIRSKQEDFEPKEILVITKQILEALYHCHCRRIFHRDIKPQNILINDKTKEVKVADFGLARVFSVPLKALTHEIETLWYRAPEVLLGLNEYCLGVDTWPVGCIIGEMLQRKPLFRGDSEIDQIFKIFQMFGTPQGKELNEIQSYPNFKKNFPKFKAETLAAHFPESDQKLVVFMGKFLELN